MKENSKTEARTRFEKILRDTGRENIDYVLEDLDSWGFFDAPASAQGHGAYPGGLVEHSLNVYDAAMESRKAMLDLRPDLEEFFAPDSIAIAALLHDVCKADFYKLVKRSAVTRWDNMKISNNTRFTTKISRSATAKNR